MFENLTIRPYLLLKSALRPMRASAGGTIIVYNLRARKAPLRQYTCLWPGAGRGNRNG